MKGEINFLPSLNSIGLYMKLSICLLNFLLLSSLFCQIPGYDIYDFSQNKFIINSNLYGGKISFTLDPTKEAVLNDFVINFILPSNIKLYNKLLLKGNKTETSYFQTTHGKILNDSIIKFAYPIITKEKGLLIYFHVIPISTGEEKIKAIYSGSDTEGKTFIDTVYSGIISTSAPPIDKLVINKFSNAELKVNAKLKYEYDYDGYVPENSSFDLVFTNGDASNKVTSQQINIVPGTATEYTVNGKIAYENTTWEIVNQKLIINGKISTEEAEKPKVIAASNSSNQAVTSIQSYSNSFQIGVGLTNAKFSEYSIGLGLMKYELSKQFSLTLSKLTLYHSFKRNKTSFTLGQELTVGNPFLDQLRFALGIEAGINLFQTKELVANFNFGLEYILNEKMSLKLIYKKHNNSAMKSDLFLTFNRAF